MLFRIFAATALLASLACVSARADTITRETFGCVSADDVWAVIRLHNSGQAKAAGSFLASRMLAGQCVPLDKGDVVAVIERGWSGLSRMQPADGGAAVWAQDEAVR